MKEHVFWAYVPCTLGHSTILIIELLTFRSMNAPIMVELEGETDPLEIARKEVLFHVFPLTIVCLRASTILS